MFWPFTRSERKQKHEMLEAVMTRQKEAAARLQDNLRKAQTDHINDLFREAMPRFEKGESQ